VSELTLKTVTLQRDDMSRSDNLLAGTTWSNCSGKTVNGMGHALSHLPGRTVILGHGPEAFGV
jgi:hypothetical protein